MIAVLKYFLGTITLLMPSLVEVESGTTDQSFSQGNLQVITIPKVEGIFGSIPGEYLTVIKYKNI